MSEQIKRLKDRIDLRLNNYLCEMKEGYDDSITGFNEAWDLVRKAFGEELEQEGASEALGEPKASEHPSPNAREDIAAIVETYTDILSPETARKVASRIRSLGE